jgi:aconitate hydratase
LSLTGLAGIAPGQPITAVLHHADGTQEIFPLEHSLNDEQVEWFKAGSALNVLRAKK